MRQDVFENLPLEVVKDHLDAVFSSGYSVSLFLDWRVPRVNQLWVKRRLENGDPTSFDPALHEALAASGDVHPLGNLSPENCTEQMGIAGPWHERLPHFRMDFTPSSGEELQAEYLVPRPACGRCAECGLRIGRTDFPDPAHLRNPQHRRRRFLDEPVLSPAVHRDPFHLEEKLAGRAKGFAADRSKPRAV